MIQPRAAIVQAVLWLLLVAGVACSHQRTTVAPTAVSEAKLMPTVEYGSQMAPRSQQTEECDVQSGIAKVNALFAALNSGEVEAFHRLLGEDGTWEVEFAPDILTAKTTAGRVTADEPRVLVRRGADLAGSADQTLGLEFRAYCRHRGRDIR